MTGYTLPRANAPIAGSDAPTIQWYNYLRYLDARVTAAPDDVQAEITTIAYKLGSPDGTVGNIPPLSSSYNFTDSENILKTQLGTLISFDLTDLADSGVGSLLATTFDAKGRKTGSHAVTVTGTANQVIVAGGAGTGAAITLGTPQDIAATSTPSFAQVALAADPTTALQAATKQYVDSVAAGLSPKAPVLLATTANDTLTGLAARDGITPVAGSRVLVKNQTLPAQNGIYIASASAWTRATDMATWAQVPSAYLWVEEGTVNADTGWVCTSDPSGVIGVTAITFVQFGGNGTVTAGTGITVSGNQVSISNTSVTPSSYGDSTHVATFTVDAQGRLTAAGSVAIGGGGAVSSVFGRTGAVVAATNDYTFAQIGTKPTTLSGYGITDAQPLDATLTALAGANWALDSLPIGSGADTVAQVNFAANTFPARASTGDLVAKPITDFGLSFVNSANKAAAQTSLDLASGTYTPTLFNTTNVSSTIARQCQYLRVGSVVTVSGRLDVTATSLSNTSTVVGISLPIASAFTTSLQLGGAGGVGEVPTATALISSDATNARATFQYYASQSGNRAAYFTFTYVII